MNMINFGGLLMGLTGERGVCKDFLRRVETDQSQRLRRARERAKALPLLKLRIA